MQHRSGLHLAGLSSMGRPLANAASVVVDACSSKGAKGILGPSKAESFVVWSKQGMFAFGASRNVGCPAKVDSALQSTGRWPWAPHWKQWQESQNFLHGDWRETALLGKEHFGADNSKPEPETFQLSCWTNKWNTIRDTASGSKVPRSCLGFCAARKC